MNWGRMLLIGRRVPRFSKAPFSFIGQSMLEGMARADSVAGGVSTASIERWMASTKLCLSMPAREMMHL
eukprot:6198192-Pleurochrysis_carterae.AAC.2